MLSQIIYLLFLKLQLIMGCFSETRIYSALDNKNLDSSILIAMGIIIEMKYGPLEISEHIYRKALEKDKNDTQAIYQLIKNLRLRNCFDAIEKIDIGPCINKTDKNSVWVRNTYFGIIRNKQNMKTTE